MKTIYLDRIQAGTQNPETHLELLKESPTTTVLDGHNGMGQVISHRAMEIAIQKAKKFGVGMTAVRNSNHFGIAGYYASMAVDAGCIGIVGTNARPSVAPTFGVENMLGTNPLTFGMPTDEAFPFMLDCATSVIQRGKVEYARRMGKSVPKGTVTDANARSMTDPDTILPALQAGRAALVALGGIGEETAGYKGYGYAVAVELLSAALQQGHFLKALTDFQNGSRKPLGLGHFFLVIDPEAFMGETSFRKTAGNILRALRHSAKAPGETHIYTAGEKEYLAWKKQKDIGLKIENPTLGELSSVCEKLKLSRYEPVFA